MAPNSVPFKGNLERKESDASQVMLLDDVTSATVLIIVNGWTVVIVTV